MNKEELVKYFELFSNPDPTCDGLERFLSINGEQEVFDRLKNSSDLKLNKVQLNQLFIMSGLTSITFGFFKYYWLTLPDKHPYNLKELELGYAEKDEKGEERLKTTGGFMKDKIETYFNSNSSGKPVLEISSIEHLRWGLLRVYTDALLYFGNITLGFNELNKKKEHEIVAYFENERFNMEILKDRGHSLEFADIEQEDRYLISEAACKNLDGENATQTLLRAKLLERYREAAALGIKNVKVGVLLDKDGDSDERDHHIPAQADHPFRAKLTRAFRGKLTTTNV